MKRMLVRATLVALACFVPAALFAQQATAPAPDNAPSDERPDPAVMLGSLKNGFRYQIQHNATPAGQVALRLRVDAGSLYENDDERGVAHLLEHMAFRGSKHFADGEAWKELQRLGLKSGADANALTMLWSTIYQLDIPVNDAKSLDTALTMLRDFAGELTLNGAALDSERSIVESETRARANPQTRLSEDALAYSFQGRRIGQRPPLGSAEVVAHATARQLRHFYNAWYRPERAVLLVVGDVDVAAFQREIDKHFSDWKGVGKAGVDPDLGRAGNRGFGAHVFSEPGIPSSVALSWITPAHARPATRASDRDGTMRIIGELLLTRRLQPLTLSANPPFRLAGAIHTRLDRATENLVTVAAQVDGDWRRALATLETMRRATVELGISQAEVNDTVQAIDKLIQVQADAAASQPSTQIIGMLLRAIDEGEMPQSAAQALEYFKAESVGVTAEEVTAALRADFSGAGPLVMVSTPTPTPEEEVTKEFQALESRPLQTQNNAPKPLWPYASFGAPGQVEHREVVKDLDITFVRFANGVRLNIKPTKFQPNQVAVLVSVGDGRLELPKDKPSAIWVAITGGYLNGGVVGIEPQNMQRALGDKLFKLGFVLGDAGFILNGETRSTDLDTQLQVLAAYVKAPAFRQQGFELARRGILAQIQQVSAAPIGLFGVNAAGLMHGGDPRWAYPKAAEVQATKPEDLRALIGNALAYGPLEVSVVGDVDVDSAVQSVAATFGALPRRASQTMEPSASAALFPKGSKEPFVLSHNGRDDQGLAAIAWPTTDIISHGRDVAVLQLLCDVMQLRLTDQLRIAIGETYSPQCINNASAALPGYGFLMASADIRPTHTQAFFDTMDKIVADLRAQPPTADEMGRVQNAEVQKLKQALQQNQFWLSMLLQSQREPRKLEGLRTGLATLEAVKPADVQKAARTYLLDKTAYRVVVKKDTTTAPAP